MFPGWDDACWSQERKKHKRYMNRLIRGVNKELVEDEMFNGRFSVRQLESAWFNDLYYVRLELRDSLTGITRQTSWIRATFLGARNLFNQLNEFIIEDVDFWNKKKKRV